MLLLSSAPCLSSCSLIQELEKCLQWLTHKAAKGGSSSLHVWGTRAWDGFYIQVITRSVEGLLLASVPHSDIIVMIITFSSNGEGRLFTSKNNPIEGGRGGRAPLKDFAYGVIKRSFCSLLLLLPCQIRLLPLPSLLSPFSSPDLYLEETTSIETLTLKKR